VAALGQLPEVLRDIAGGQAETRSEWFTYCCLDVPSQLVTVVSTDAATAGELREAADVVASAAFALAVDSWDEGVAQLEPGRRRRHFEAFLRAGACLLATRDRVTTHGHEAALAADIVAVLRLLGAEVGEGAHTAVADALDGPVVASGVGARSSRRALLHDILTAAAQAEPGAAAAATTASLWIDLLAGDGGGPGSVTRLEVGRLPGRGQLVEHPYSSLAPLKADFRASVSTAWRAAQPAGGSPTSLWWRVIAEQEAPLEGSSAGAAFAVAFGLAAGGEPYDTQVAVLATVDEHGTLGPVDGVETKLAAARDVRIAVISSGQTLATTPQGVTLQRVDDVAAAAHQASERVRLVHDYLTRVTRGVERELIDSRFLRDVDVAQMYVEPVLIEIGTGADVPDAEAPAGGPLENDDGRTQVYRQSADDQRPRVSPAQLRSELTPRSTTLIEGAPGSGKSLLVQAEAAEAARAQLQRLRAGALLDDIVIPVHVVLTRLESRLSPAEAANRAALSGVDGPDRELRRAIALCLLEEHGQELAVWIGDRLDPRRADQQHMRLFFDGHDELESPSSLGSHLSGLEAWTAPVVITSRPGHDHRIWMRSRDRAGRRTLAIAPFDQPQIDAFIGKRFGGAAIRERTAEALGPGTPLAIMAQSPFLLTLLCWLADQDLLSADLTRTQVYDRVLEELLRSPDDPSRAEDLRELLAEVVLYLLIEGRMAQPISHRELVALIGASTRRPRPLSGGRGDSDHGQAREIVDELKAKRVLVSVDSGSRWAFPHLTIAEYLAGVEIADGLRGARHVGQKSLWLAGLEERYRT
jgi:hypothetical protein